jgi:nuclear factor NF-kappa-B p105 subunit
MDRVRLKFHALSKEGKPLTGISGLELVAFSNPIANKKCASHEALFIQKASHLEGLCTGNEEILLFVNKVDKKGIKVRFFEHGSDWEAFGEFSEKDVWHQYGISFRTPHFRDQDIDYSVKVF